MLTHVITENDIVTIDLKITKADYTMIIQALFFNEAACLNVETEWMIQNQSESMDEPLHKMNMHELEAVYGCVIDKTRVTYYVANSSQ